MGSEDNQEELSSIKYIAKSNGYRPDRIDNSNDYRPDQEGSLSEKLSSKWF